MTDRCDGCSSLTDPDNLVTVDVLVCRQTHSSPAEYEPMRLCASCLNPDVEERRAFERADAIYRERTGSHL